MLTFRIVRSRWDRLGSEPERARFEVATEVVPLPVEERAAEQLYPLTAAALSETPAAAVSEGDDSDATTDDEVVDSYVTAIQQIRPEFDRSWIKQHWVFRAPFAQPIVTTNYLDSLPPHRTPLTGVYLANMAHVYPQDRGQNYSLRLGERMARLMGMNL